MPEIHKYTLLVGIFRLFLLLISFNLCAIEQRDGKLKYSLFCSAIIPGSPLHKIPKQAIFFHLYLSSRFCAALPLFHVDFVERHNTADNKKSRKAKASS